MKSWPLQEDEITVEENDMKQNKPKSPHANTHGDVKPKEFSNPRDDVSKIGHNTHNRLKKRKRVKLCKY